MRKVLLFATSSVSMGMMVLMAIQNSVADFEGSKRTGTMSEKQDNSPSAQIAAARHEATNFSDSVMVAWIRQYEHDEAIALFLDSVERLRVIGKNGRQSKNYSDVTYSAEGTLETDVKFVGPDYEVDDTVNPTAIDSKGNLYVTGSIFNASEKTNFHTIKYDASHHEVWEAIYNGPANEGDRPGAIAVDHSGNVFVTGVSRGSSSDTDILTIKYDQLGVEQWTQRFSPSAQEPGSSYAVGLVVDANDNVIVAGANRFAGHSFDYTIIKYDKNGVEKWCRHYNGPSSGEDVPTAIQVDDAGNVYLTGHSSGDDTSLDYATIKYDQHGTELWIARYNSLNNGSDWPLDLIIDKAGWVYVTGDNGTVKYDPSGNELWRHSIGGGFIALDSSGNAYLAGSPEWQDVVLAKISADGALKWSHQYGRPSSVEFPMGLNVNKRDEIFIVVTSYENSGAMHFSTIKYVQNSRIVKVEDEKTPTEFALLPSFPNPLDLSRAPFLTIRYRLPQPSLVNLQVFNVAGQLVANLAGELKEAGEHAMQWQPGDLPSGVYFYRMQVKNTSSGARQGFVATRKVVLFK